MPNHNEDLRTEGTERLPGWFNKPWKSYRTWAIQNQKLLFFLDEGLGHLLFWTPVSEKDETTRARQVLWGVLQLHRVAFEVATDLSPLEQGYGTSVAVKPDIPAAGIRVGITILQSLWPVAQELVRDASDSERTVRRQAKARLYIERIRFLLRLSLLASYWRKTMKRREINPGILLHGGLFRPVHAPGVEQEQARLARQNYVGRRTGRRLRIGMETKISVFTKLRVLLGELLYFSRPVLMAEIEYRWIPKQVPWETLMLCLSMDIVSLRTLGHASSVANTMTKTELRRRKVRLLLYLLRAPLWERATRPTVERLVSFLERIPLFGKLASNYIMEYLMFWKLYGAEEG
jgi:hypothetical protein